MSVVRTGDLQKEAVFQYFHKNFHILLQFTIISHVEKIVFQVEIKIANTKAPKKLLTLYIVSVFLCLTGVITCKKVLHCVQNELQRTCETKPAGENSSLILTVCVKSVPF